MKRYVDLCNYSGVDTPIELIEGMKLYIVGPDFDWADQILNKVITALQ